MSSREKIPDQEGFIRYMKPVMISIIVGAIICMVMLILCSVILSTQNIPQSIIEPMSTFAVALGALVAGVTCAKLMKQNGLMCGLISGGALALVMLIASFGVAQNGLGAPAVFKIVFMLIAGMIGGVFGINSKHKKQPKVQKRIRKYD